jgi:hypothetical protein
MTLPLQEAAPWVAGIRVMADKLLMLLLPQLDPGLTMPRPRLALAVGAMIPLLVAGRSISNPISKMRKTASDNCSWYGQKFLGGRVRMVSFGYASDMGFIENFRPMLTGVGGVR